MNAPTRPAAAVASGNVQFQRVAPPPGTFRAAVETRDLSAIAMLLDPAVAFHSPVMVKPYRGRDQVSALIGVLLGVFEDFHYTGDLIDSASTSAHGYPQGRGAAARALIFDATVLGKAVQGLDLLQFNEAGLVVSLTVMVRPLPAAMTLARAVGKRMEQAALHG